MAHTVLVIGGSGYIGQHLVQTLSRTHYVVSTYHRNFKFTDQRMVQLDIRDRSAVMDLMSSLTPDFVFHLAYDRYDLDRCVIEGTRHVLDAWASQGRNSRLVFVSTDAVFDGESPPYSEESPPSPIYPYGRAKRNAELLTLEKGAQVIRISIVYGFDPPDSRTKVLLSGARTGNFPHAYFSDEVRSPVFVQDLCQALMETMHDRLSKYRILHVAGPQPINRYSMASKIVEAFGYRASLPKSTLRESGLVRPRDITLSTQLAQAVLSTKMRSIDQVTNDILSGNI